MRMCVFISLWFGAGVWAGFTVGCSYTSICGWFAFFIFEILLVLFLYILDKKQAPYRIRMRKLRNGIIAYFIQRKFFFEYEYFDRYNHYGTWSVLPKNLRIKAKDGEVLSSRAAAYFTDLDDAKTAVRLLTEDYMISNSKKPMLGCSKNIYI